MAYINKEMVLEKVKKLANDLSSTCLAPPLMIREIENMPDEDVVEVKHGYWKWFAHNSKTRTCSICNISQTVNVYKNKVMFNYCPYCGAKMDLERNSVL